MTKYQILQNLFHGLFIKNVVIRQNEEQEEGTLIKINIQSPKQKRQNNIHVNHLPKYSKVKDNITYCSICCEYMKMGEYMRMLPLCFHSFHKKCIDKWFLEDYDDMSCPNCRKSYSIE